eukprot:3044688-Amphidinium_carterae.1
MASSAEHYPALHSAGGFVISNDLKPERGDRTFSRARSQGSSRLLLVTAVDACNFPELCLPGGHEQKKSTKLKLCQ